jgi:hypothetical protein
MERSRDSVDFKSPRRIDVRENEPGSGGDRFELLVDGKRIDNKRAAIGHRFSTAEPGFLADEPYIVHLVDKAVSRVIREYNFDEIGSSIITISLPFRVPWNPFIDRVSSCEGSVPTETYGPLPFHFKFGLRNGQTLIPYRITSIPSSTSLKEAESRSTRTMYETFGSGKTPTMTDDPEHCGG